VSVTAVSLADCLQQGCHKIKDKLGPATLTQCYETFVYISASVMI